MGPKRGRPRQHLYCWPHGAQDPVICFVRVGDRAAAEHLLSECRRLRPEFDARWITGMEAAAICALNRKRAAAWVAEQGDAPHDPCGPAGAWPRMITMFRPDA